MNKLIDIEERLISLINKEQWRTLKVEMDKIDPVLLAGLLDDIEGDNKLILFRLLNSSQAKDVFKLLSYNDQKAIVDGLRDAATPSTRHRVSKLLNDLEPDDRTAFLKELPVEVAQQLIDQLSPEQRKIAVKLLSYPEDSIGRLMTTEFIAIRPEYTVKEAFKHIREYGPDSETLNIIYVVDEKMRLIDDISIKKLILAEPEEIVNDLIDYQFISLNAHEDQEAAIQVFKDYDLVALPVVSEQGEMLGIVTFDDIMDVAEEESSEDFHKFGGMEQLDFPYVETPFLSLIKKRSGWLIILFIGEMFTATAMGYFDEEISKAIVLALFIPLIISSGGNSGSQAATIIIRAMSLKEITLQDWWYVMKKEFSSGVLLGAILGVIGFLRITFWQLMGWYDYGEYWILLALTIGVSLIGVVLWGTLSGSFIPMILKRLGLDPATASAPFVATLVDVTGIVIYFMVALAFLSGTLL